MRLALPVSVLLRTKVERLIGITLFAAGGGAIGMCSAPPTSMLLKAPVPTPGMHQAPIAAGEGAMRACLVLPVSTPLMAEAWGSGNRQVAVPQSLIPACVREGAPCSCPEPRILYPKACAAHLHLLPALDLGALVQVVGFPLGHQAHGTRHLAGGDGRVHLHRLSRVSTAGQAGGFSYKVAASGLM